MTDAGTLFFLETTPSGNLNVTTVYTMMVSSRGHRTSPLTLGTLSTHIESPPALVMFSQWVGRCLIKTRGESVKPLLNELVFVAIATFSPAVAQDQEILQNGGTPKLEPYEESSAGKLDGCGLALRMVVHVVGWLRRA